MANPSANPWPAGTYQQWPPYGGAPGYGYWAAWAAAAAQVAKKAKKHIRRSKKDKKEARDSDEKAKKRRRKRGESPKKKKGKSSSSSSSSESEQSKSEDASKSASAQKDSAPGVNERFNDLMQGIKDDSNSDSEAQQRAGTEASNPKASSDSSWALVWISDQAFKPTAVSLKAQLEGLGCQVKAYKTHKNAIRALDKKRVLDKTVVMVTGAEAPPFLEYIASRPELASTPVVVEATSESIPVRESPTVQVCDSFDTAASAVWKIAHGPGADKAELFDPEAPPQEEPPKKQEQPARPEPANSAAPAAGPQEAETDKEARLLEWLRSLDGGRGAMLQYFSKLKEEFESDFDLLVTVRRTGQANGLLGSVDPAFWEACGVKQLGHRLLFAKGLRALP